MDIRAERSLCFLVGKDPQLDGKNYLKLTVPTTNFKNLDAFTMNRFQDSEEIRGMYGMQIAEFLLKNPHFENEKNSIVLIQFPTDDMSLPFKKSVLYMNTKQKLYEIFNNRTFLKWKVKEDERKNDGNVLRLFTGSNDPSVEGSDYFADAVLKRNGQTYTDKDLKRILTVTKGTNGKTWLESKLHDPYHGTDRLRLLLKDYERWLKIEREKAESNHENTRIYQNVKHDPEPIQIRKAEKLKEELSRHLAEYVVTEYSVNEQERFRK